MVAAVVFLAFVVFLVRGFMADSVFKSELFDLVLDGVADVSVVFSESLLVIMEEVSFVFLHSFTLASHSLPGFSLSEDGRFCRPVLNTG